MTIRILDEYALMSRFYYSHGGSAISKYVPKPIKRFIERQIALLSYKTNILEIRELADRQEMVAARDDVSALEGAAIIPTILAHVERAKHLLKVARKRGARNLRLGSLEVWI